VRLIGAKLLGLGLPPATLQRIWRAKQQIAAAVLPCGRHPTRRLDALSYGLPIDV